MRRFLPLLMLCGPLAADEGTDFFEKNIRPVLASRCYVCHSVKASPARNHSTPRTNRANSHAAGTSDATTAAEVRSDVESRPFRPIASAICLPRLPRSSIGVMRRRGQGVPQLLLIGLVLSVPALKAAARPLLVLDTGGHSSRVTQALNDIHLTADPVRRLAMAEEARENLAAWPAANYGYRAADIARLVGMLDEVVTGLQAATGKTPFELSLVATTIEPPSFVDLQPAPGMDATIESAFRAAMVSPVPGERIELLRGIASALERLPQSPFRTSLRATASTLLDSELKVERAYEELVRTAIRDADQRAARGDARGLQQIIARALVTDDRLGRQRMAEMSALLAALDLRLTEANRVRLAREACARCETPDRPRFVAGSMGPGTKTISVTGGVTFDQVRNAYAEQTAALLAGGVDVLFLETQQDTLNVKAALLGIDRAFATAGQSVPIVLSVSIETMGTMLAGQSIEALYVSVAHRDLLAIGLNCATGPDFMTDHLRTLAAVSRFPVSCFPNAGLPDEEGRYNETPESLVRKLERFCAEGWVNIVGGCCGTNPEYIRRVVQAVAGLPPRAIPHVPHYSTYSNLNRLELRADEFQIPTDKGQRTKDKGQQTTDNRQTDNGQRTTDN